MGAERLQYHHVDSVHGEWAGRLVPAPAQTWWCELSPELGLCPLQNPYSDVAPG